MLKKILLLLVLIGLGFGAHAQEVTAPGRGSLQLLPYSYQQPTNLFTITIPNGVSVLIIDPSGTLAAGTITLPASPADQQVVYVTSTQIVTTLTVQGSGGQTLIGTLAVFAVGGNAGWVYRAANTTWYRIS